MKDWKQAERRIATILGDERGLITGRQCGDTPNIEHPALSIEVKSRKSISARIKNSLEQAKSVSRYGKTPLCVLQRNGRRYADALWSSAANQNP